MTGAAIGLAVFLTYVLIVQCLMAAIVLLCEFTILRIQALRALLRAVETAPEKPAPAPEPATEPYLIGGGIRKWE